MGMGNAMGSQGVSSSGWSLHGGGGWPQDEHRAAGEAEVEDDDRAGYLPW